MGVWRGRVRRGSVRGPEGSPEAVNMLSSTNIKEVGAEPPLPPRSLKKDQRYVTVDPQETRILDETVDDTVDRRRGLARGVSNLYKINNGF
jgi:hypothetical protein